MQCKKKQLLFSVGGSVVEILPPTQEATVLFLMVMYFEQSRLKSLDQTRNCKNSRPASSWTRANELNVQKSLQ